MLKVPVPHISGGRMDDSGGRGGCGCGCGCGCCAGGPIDLQRFGVWSRLRNPRKRIA